MIQKHDENEILEQKCKLLLNENGVRFVGILSNMGRQIAGGYKEGVVPLVDYEDHKMCLEHALGILLTKDLDESLGSIDYLIAKRKKVIMITLPMQKYAVLISAELDANIEKIITNATKLLSN